MVQRGIYVPSAAPLSCIIRDGYFRLLFMMRCWPLAGRYVDPLPRMFSAIRTVFRGIRDRSGRRSTPPPQRIHVRVHTDPSVIQRFSSETLRLSGDTLHLFLEEERRIGVHLAGMLQAVLQGY